MKKTLTISILMVATIILACEKNKPAPPPQITKTETPSENCGPYGKFSKWKSVSGDSVFSDTLTLTFFYVEKHLPCDVFYYQQNYSFWNDYDYTLSVSKCAVPKDSLLIQDQNTTNNAVFIRLK